MKKARVLFVSQEMMPYLESSEIAEITRKLPQGIQEAGKEIRTFIPKYGSINERRNQLHEVIRLSGLNLIIDDTDHPLVIKVASIQAAKMQVYFIDNDDYFANKVVLNERSSGKLLANNDERSIFFCRGVLETVKKLGWAPNIIHVHGWFSALIPIYLKKIFSEDPIYDNTKIVYSVYNNEFEGALDKRYIEKAIIEDLDIADLKIAEDPTFININKLAVEYSDAVIAGSETINSEIETYIKESGKPFLSYHNEEEMISGFNAFYDEVLEENSILAE